VTDVDKLYNFPEELRALPQWVMWKYVKVGDVRDCGQPGDIWRY
jgi:primase-polymerase (primpol)-like protein